jgi:hypothetical protein
MLHRVALVRTDVSEELSASFIRVTGLGELGTTLAVTSLPSSLILAFCSMYYLFIFYYLFIWLYMLLILY